MVFNERLTPEQKTLLVDMIRQKQLRILRRYAAGELNSPVLVIVRTEWKEMAAQLNPLSPGPGKTADDWYISWAAIKSRLKLKYDDPYFVPDTALERTMFALIRTQQKAQECVRNKEPMVIPDGDDELAAYGEYSELPSNAETPSTSQKVRSILD